MGRIVGIDLGTTNSVVAVMDRHGPVVVPNSLGDRVTPSVVGFAKNGDILVGKKARRAAVMNVGRTVFSIKRHMGTNHKERIDGKDYTPQEISAMVLQKLKQDTSDFFGEEVVDCVITVPAYFTDAQRQATKDAGEIAGFNVRRIIDEPTAAALAYGLDKNTDQTLLVYDLGGGTFDVSIIEVISGVFRVLAIHGDTHLGGDDFDQVLMDYLCDEFKKENGVDLTEDPVALMRVRDASEEAKMELSESQDAQVLIEAVTMGDSGPLTLDVTITREKFESLIEPLVRRTVEPMNAALEDAGLTPDKVDTVLLVGGSTRIPLVQRVVNETLNKKPARDISPDECVALGAAVQTLVLAPLEADIEDSLAARYGKEKPVIIHMTPFSLGLGIKDDQFAPVIERNSTYPTEAKDIFTTTRDFQEAISFPIYEGEEPIASENTFLDLLRIEGITPAPRGVPRIEVTFRLNPDRILEVRAEDLATGLEQSITIAATGARLSDPEKNRMIKESRERVMKQLRDKIANNQQEGTEQLLARARDLMISHPEHPKAPEISEMINRLSENSSDQALLDHLTRLVTEIETSAM